MSLAGGRPEIVSFGNPYDAFIDRITGEPNKLHVVVGRTFVFVRIHRRASFYSFTQQMWNTTDVRSSFPPPTRRKTIRNFARDSFSYREHSRTK